jgi:hypothetical protein
MMKRTRTFEPTLENQLKTYKSDFTYGKWSAVQSASAGPGSHAHRGLVLQ